MGDETNLPFYKEISEALAKLNNNNDADWQEDGKPSLKRVIALAGNDQITAEQVEAVAPDLVRGEKDSDEKAKKAALKKGAKDKEPEAGKPLENVRVRAIETGQYGGALRKAGEEFTYTGPKGKWFVVLKD